MRGIQSSMKRRGGDDGGRTMVFDAKDAAELMTGPRTEMEDLCSKLMSLIPQDYLNDSQGSSDLPSQLAQATNYIKDLRGRVEKLKQRRDECYAKVLKSSRVNTAHEAAPEPCSQDVRVQSTGAAHFDVKLTMDSEKCVDLHKVICAIEQDRCVEIVEASSCIVEDGKIVYTISCRATSSEVGFDAPMVAMRLTRLFTE